MIFFFLKGQRKWKNLNNVTSALIATRRNLKVLIRLLNLKKVLLEVFF